MADAEDDRTDESEDSPTLRQRLHAATGDRDAEADALADRAPAEVEPEAAKIAVQRAHGERDGGDEVTTTPGALAGPEDAEEVDEVD